MKHQCTHKALTFSFPLSIFFDWVLLTPYSLLLGPL